TSSKRDWSSDVCSSDLAGAAIAPLIIVPIIASHGWRVSFYFLGILGLILVGLYYLIERPIKSKKETTTVKKINWREVDKRIWIFVIIGLVLNVITKGLETWMPIYFLQA